VQLGIDLNGLIKQKYEVCENTAFADGFVELHN